MVLTDIVDCLADLATDLADMVPRLIVIAAVFLAFNMLAVALCYISPGVCGLAFIACNIAAFVVVLRKLCD